MKVLLSVVFGFTLLPILSIGLFTICNWLLSLILPFTFEQITNSGIWYFEGLATVFTIIVYYCTNPFNANWNE